jgi:hypothetical protein
VCRVTAESRPQPHTPERATIGFERAQLAALPAAGRQRIAEVYQALGRNNDGGYGVTPSSISIDTTACRIVRQPNGEKAGLLPVCRDGTDYLIRRRISIEVRGSGHLGLSESMAGLRIRAAPAQCRG